MTAPQLVEGPEIRSGSCQELVEAVGVGRCTDGQYMNQEDMLAVDNREHPGSRPFSRFYFFLSFFLKKEVSAAANEVGEPSSLYARSASTVATLVQIDALRRLP